MGTGVLPPPSIDASAFCNSVKDHVCDCHEEPQGDPICGGQCLFSDVGRWIFNKLRPSTSKCQAPEPPYVALQQPRQSISDQSDNVVVDDEQLASPLFRLPAEIRIMIYEMLLCDHQSIQLNLEYGPLSTPGNNQWYMWHRTVKYPTFDKHGLLPPLKAGTARQLDQSIDTLNYYRNVRKQQPKLAVSLIQTCRKAYREATPMIYQKNTFLLQTDLLARKIDRFFPTYRHLIRSVELVWELSHEHQPPASPQAMQSYKDLWLSLDARNLPALRRLRVIIDPPGRNWHFNKELCAQSWLNPVAEFASTRKLDFFEFAIPESYLEDFDETIVNNRTFNLRRMRDLKDDVSYCFGSEDDRPDCLLSWQSFAPGEPIHPADCTGCDLRTNLAKVG